MVFQEEYFSFGKKLVCNIVQASSPFALEKDIYSFIKKYAQKDGWKFMRVDTVDQIGMPDIVLLKGDQYNLIEGKQLKKKKLSVIEDDLNFEFGQLAFAARSLSLRINYTLAVSKGNQLALIQGEYNRWKIVC